MNEVADPSWSNTRVAFAGQRPGDIRRNNRAIALELLRERPRGRAELAREMKLSKAALGDLMTQLIAESLVLKHPPAPTSRGRHPAPLSINAERFCVIGIDLAVRGLEVGLYDASGRLLEISTEDSGVGAGTEAVYARLLSATERLMTRAAHHHRQVVAAIGIATPGPLDLRHGQVLSPPSFADLTHLKLAARLESNLGLPVLLERDATAATLAHLRQTRARDFVFILLNEGIGAGIVIARHVFRGVHGFAGEFGHVSIDSQGLPCACGNCGCVERYAGSAAIQDHYGSRAVPILELAALARGGDERAQQAFRAAGEALGLACVTLVNLLDPKQIVLGGPGASWADLLLPAMRAKLTERAYPFLGWGQQLPIEISAVERPIGRGASERVLDAIFREEIKLPDHALHLMQPRASSFESREETAMG